MNSNGENEVFNGNSKPFSNGVAAQSKAALSKGINGASKGRYTNGSISTNDHSSTTKNQSPTYLGHSREEVSRLILQALQDLGYTSSAANLVQESGFELEAPIVAAFRQAVMQGSWVLAESLLFGDATSPTLEMENGRRNGEIPRQGLPLAAHAQPSLMRFWLRKQKFLELLEARETHLALKVLRTELTPLNQDHDKLHFLSSLLMCDTVEEMRAKAKWDGAEGSSRLTLLSQLSKFISASVMIAPHRLMTLLDQVNDLQVSNCLYHNTENKPSLLRDHQCVGENFPPTLAAELTGEHTGEVWNLEFSHDGKKLATCGSEGQVVVWDMSTFEALRSLLMHDNTTETGYGVIKATWSPDDTLILTSSMDKRVRLWEVETGELVHTTEKFDEPVTGCAWHPDGATFVVGFLGLGNNLQQLDLSGECIAQFSSTGRVLDIALSPNGRHLVTIDHKRHLSVIDLLDREQDYKTEMADEMSSVAISEDSKNVLLGTKDGEARLVGIKSKLLRKSFVGQVSREFMIKTTFGGAHDAFVATGSEDGHVFIWRKDSGHLVQTFKAHYPKTCNVIAWNGARHAEFATGGDDHIVKIWSIACKNGNSESPLELH